MPQVQLWLSPKSVRGYRWCLRKCWLSRGLLRVSARGILMKFHFPPSFLLNLLRFESLSYSCFAWSSKSFPRPTLPFLSVLILAKRPKCPMRCQSAFLQVSFESTGMMPRELRIVFFPKRIGELCGNKILRLQERPMKSRIWHCSSMKMDLSNLWLSGKCFTSELWHYQMWCHQWLKLSKKVFPWSC